ncbi:unnamed protein product [Sphagnum jensenii]|uniref:Uncharacterized protein n=1 Tax=Sphagnum jensenii TaxID=128206 RepID=A0ABP0X7R8_9BRYO
MDHKRGYNLVEQAHEYAARKRLKDLSHSGSLFAAATRCNNNNNNTNNFHDANTTTRAKANKYPEVEKGSQQQPQQQSAHVKHIEDVTYRRLLPVVKKELMESQKWFQSHCKGFQIEDHGCAVCLDEKKFKGWDALLIHAENYSKHHVHEHRGYFRAMKEALPDDGKQAPSSKAARAREGQGGPTKWPNILIVENDKLSQMEQIMGGNKTTNNRPPTSRLKENSSSKEEPQLKEILAVYSDGDKKNIFVFPANEVGYIGKSELHNRYGHATNSQGGKRDANCKGFKSSLCESNEPKLDSFSQTKHPLNIRGFWKAWKDKHGLQLLPEEKVHDHHGELFDPTRFNRVSNLVNKWSEQFVDIANAIRTPFTFKDDPKVALRTLL